MTWESQGTFWVIFAKSKSFNSQSLAMRLGLQQVEDTCERAVAPVLGSLEKSLPGVSVTGQWARAAPVLYGTQPAHDRCSGCPTAPLASAFPQSLSI